VARQSNHLILGVKINPGTITAVQHQSDMKNENEIALKRAYWSGVYFALDPEDRKKSGESARAWLSAEVWLTALDWVVGDATEASTVLENTPDRIGGWDT
jgi:hypothetical protein